MSRPFVFLAFFLFVGFAAQAQHAASISEPHANRFWVFFANKGPDRAASLRRGFDASYSTRSKARRERQAIPFDYHDLPVHGPYRESVEAVPGVRVITTSRWLNGISIAVADPGQLAAISALPAVKNVQTVKRYRVPQSVESTPADQASIPRRADAADMTNDALGPVAYGPAAQQVAMLGVDYLHEQGYQGLGVLVGVLDAGFRGIDIDPAFERLWTQNRIVDAWNFEHDNDSVFAFSNHGTAVLSCIGGLGENGTYAGTAPEASFALYRTEVTAFERLIEEDYWVAGAERADALGVDIINTSLGYTTFDSVDAAMNHTYADMDGNTTVITRGADMAASRGILVVASAGNQGASNWRYIGAPADGDSVMAVGAVDEFGDYAFFSSLGPSADGDVKPNVAALGLGTWVQNQFGEVRQGNGTSFAAPLIAGAAASLWGAFPHADNMTVFDAIQRSASQFQKPDDSLGYGIPNFASAFQSLRGVPAQPADEVLAAWPNPLVGDRLWIWLDETWAGKQLRFTLFDAHGRELRAWTTQLGQSSGHAYPIAGLSALSAGTYVLRVLQDDRLRTVKVVKSTLGSSAIR